MTSKSKLARRVWQQSQLERAWRDIRDNARASTSQEVQREIEAFEADPGRGLRSIAARLARNKFEFRPAKGIPIPKTESDGRRSRTKFRPIVLAPLESRIVQRSILEVLLSQPALRSYVHTPYSFGGIRRTEGETRGAVPAAIEAVLTAIGSGAGYVVVADIRAFFTRISKSAVCDMIAAAIQDDEFMSLVRRATEVELANLAELREKAKEFPIQDIGVAQGNSLSPLLGNVLLHGFDKKMNEGDCCCFRYIDDFIILAPTKEAAKARLKLATRLLDAQSMTLSPEKSTQEPMPVKQKFEFLGIELNNGLIRPSAESCNRLVARVEDVLTASAKAFVDDRNGTPIPKTKSLVHTLRRIDGVIQGWGKHYRFCNDPALFQRIDGRVTELISRYIGAYSDARTRAAEERRQALLGVERLQDIECSPLAWPRTGSRD